MLWDFLGCCGCWAVSCGSRLICGLYCVWAELWAMGCGLGLLVGCGLWAGGYGLWEGRASQIRKVFSKFRITEQ